DHLALPEEEKPNVEGVLRALGRLPFNQRAALVMRELEGRSYAEIADTLGVSVAAVETLIFRARRSLRVRTATLRSLLTVPVPSSLTQLFEGGGGAAAGGIGAGMLIKAAVALVVGGVATGLGVERSTHAAAPPRPAATAPTTLARHTVVRSAKPHAPRAVRSKPEHAAHRVARTGIAPLASSRQGLPTSPSVASSSEAAPPAGAASPTKSVEDVPATVEQTVSQVTAALPVSVPQVPPLPVQPPPVPTLP